MHVAPTYVTIRKIEDTPHLVEIIFFGPTIPPEGANAVYLRADVLEWLERWFSTSNTNV